MIARIFQMAIPFIWFGLIGGISFMEAPLKFQAPNITIPLGLGIGRLVFFALNKIEIILAILMLITFVKVKLKGKLARFSFDIIVFLLFLETVWLLPVLDARAVEVINGMAEPVSGGFGAHFIYIAFDAIKFVLLPSLGVSIAKNNLKFEQNEKRY